MDIPVTILPLTYLGNIEYFSLLCSGEDVVIDLGENYVKQTYRNRCEIMTSGGVTPLTVNVVKGRSIRKQAVKDMRIDYSKRWQHQHKISLVSAYKNSPYFDHYWRHFEPFFEKEFMFLADLNAGLLEKAGEVLKMEKTWSYSQQYLTPSPSDNDLRGAFAPIERNPQGGIPATSNNSLCFKPYYQVFSEKYPFAPNLSVIDLIFCEGPAARSFLKQ